MNNEQLNEATKRLLSASSVLITAIQGFQAALIKLKDSLPDEPNIPNTVGIKILT